MAYIKKVNIKGQEYYYLFHTIRNKDKFLKKSKYLGKEIPKNIEEIKKQFLLEISKPKSDNDLIIESLTPLERAIFPLLTKYNTVSNLEEHSKLKEVEIIRAIQWLESKKILEIKIDTKEIVSLDKNGLEYVKKGLPEKQFLKLLPASQSKLREHLSQEEVNVSIGTLKRKSAITFGKQIVITDKGKQILKEKTPEEKFLEKLPLEISKVDKQLYKDFSKRKQIIKTDLKKLVSFELTKLGKEVTKLKVKTNLAEKVTPEMLSFGKWKGKTFRRYDVKSISPRQYPGKRHFVNQAAEYVRRIWLDLGFEEMNGPFIDSSFWVFDALFTAQDHPVREMQDTFFIKGSKEIPKELAKKVKEQHEKGWKYSWKEAEAKKPVLRTHTTNLSVRTLAKLDLKDLPKKYFSLSTVFRNETLDWSHLFELNQTEGIVIDENVNFRHLLGYLKEFFRKMGYDKARFRPAYFPYTEPSVEIDVFHPIHKKWMELGGAGVFRPEVVIPLLGKDIPVLAWGPGFDRSIMDYYKITDIRDLYKNDLKQLREMKLWIK